MIRTHGDLTVREIERPYEPGRHGVLLELERGGEVRRLYLDIGKAPLGQQHLDRIDPELMEKWWGKAGQLPTLGAEPGE